MNQECVFYTLRFELDTILIHHINASTYTSLFVVDLALKMDSGAIHLIGSRAWKFKSTHQPIVRAIQVDVGTFVRQYFLYLQTSISKVTFHGESQYPSWCILVLVILVTWVLLVYISSCKLRASPKSEILHTLFSPTNTFRAAKSRWTTFKKQKKSCFLFFNLQQKERVFGGYRNCSCFLLVELYSLDCRHNVAGKEKGEDISYMTNEKVMILNEPSCRKIRISF